MRRCAEINVAHSDARWYPCHLEFLPSGSPATLTATDVSCTDGNRWDFYLSMAEGVPSERRFYRLELQLEHKIPEYVDFLEQHLRKGRVVSGEARIVAEQRQRASA